MQLISIYDAAKKGITRIRNPKWYNSMDHIEINIKDDRPTLWMHLWSPMNDHAEGPQQFCIFDIGGEAALKSKMFIPYDGPLPNTEEYKKEAISCNILELLMSREL